MLADSRSDTLATRFAAQWLHLSDLDTMNPDPSVLSAVRPNPRSIDAP